MGRNRSKSRSYSPRRYSRSPPRRKRYDDPRDRYRGGPSRSFRDRRGAPSGLLIRNISLDARPEDLRIPFERFGPVKDVYLPKNYYTGEPRGFGFVKYRYPEDAAEAKLQMNHQIIGGREISIVFAEENRKTPQDMRVSARISSGRYNGYSRGRSPPRSPRRRYRSYSRSFSPRHDSRGHERATRDEYYSPPRSRTPPAGGDGHYKSLKRSPSPESNVRRSSRSRSYSPT
ncbi:serine/arginine-rich SC35-like splicing factor SCL28 isoform X3 [Phalaenopsis equestris]|uniref:serine/arginine-rich SC35-like splicing factor SCL28 isoform X3 n=1 Tax=Phalaenopsis equestris TaxID=78828 RepID=UPI0009E20A03|nr:serine/arginine-rich SC35-like splicing factor SCL28 isoform X3 [Phalaenopsis equestris]